MSSQRKQFPFSDYEPRWQSQWLEGGAFRSLNPGDPGFDAAKPKFYVLDMFPYPSGEGLHVGHVEGYTATDIVARYKRMKGFNVLHPMGWDAFGLPAEQFAIKTGKHPRETTNRNIRKFRSQLQSLGFSYDWDREISTTHPEYFRWTQWIFLQLYGSWFNPETRKAEPISTYSGEDPDSVRLAYVAEVPVNWCPELGTVLANEEVVDGKSEVGGFPVERRPLRQWMLRITAYADRLLEGLDDLDWPEGVKLLQRNWIGRSEGASVIFEIPDHQTRVEVFTTRPDTLFGASYVVLAPEHPLVPVITTPEYSEAVEAYKKSIASKSDLERTELAKEKSGVFTGAFATNPVNGEAIPVWIADYVLMGYGTGAIMAVPAHDERDFEFATRFELPIRQVVGQSCGIGFQPMKPNEGVEIRQGGNLPHWTQTGVTYSVVFRLADSLPQSAIREISEERKALLVKHEAGGSFSPAEREDFQKFFSEKIEALLDAGLGNCSLSNPEVAEVVFKSLNHFDGNRYDLLAWCIMPNHVHVIFTARESYDLQNILHSWKSFSANEANKILGTSGEFWQKESYDRIIRDSTEFSAQVQYVLNNPAKAGFQEWKWVGQKKEHRQDADVTCYSGEGVAMNSGFLDGLPTAQAKSTVTAWLEERGLGSKKVNTKLRDWLFSRQRYWGEPFPILWENGGHRPLPESELPLVQPEMSDFKPTGTPEPPLSKAVDWVRYSETASRETNTMPQWAGSCWYYLRFCDPGSSAAFASKDAETYWMGGPSKPGGVDLYIGGTEHAVLHLLYARFWHKVLFDLGHVSTPEPFKKLVNQGMILGPDNQKMSKSRGNVVTPENVISEYGADSLRLYEMFMGPLEQMKPWSMKGVEGVYRFLARVWRLAMTENQEGQWELASELADQPPTAAENRMLHATIKKVTEDLENLAFNTAISQLMICTNQFVNANPRPVEALRVILTLLSPMAPHLCEELWSKLDQKFPGFSGSASTQPWPSFDPAVLDVAEVEYIVQVNGKLRDRVLVSKEIPEEELTKIASNLPKVQEVIAGKQVVKTIVVPGKLVNLVAR